MSDLVLFCVLFFGLFILRVVAATFVFLFLLPQGDRCIMCDDPTVRIASPLADRCFPWFRKRWCLTCGWVGMLRRGPISEPVVSREKAAPRNS